VVGETKKNLAILRGPSPKGKLLDQSLLSDKKKDIWGEILDLILRRGKNKRTIFCLLWSYSTEKQKTSTPKDKESYKGRTHSPTRRHGRNQCQRVNQEKIGLTTLSRPGWELTRYSGGESSQKWNRVQNWSGVFETEQRPGGHT